MHGGRMDRALSGGCRIVAGMVLAMSAAGCPKTSPNTGAMQQAPNVNVSADLLQLRVYEAGRDASVSIIAAADSIALVSSDPAVRRRALQWKISAVPLVQEASLRNDPLVAGVDLAAFGVQQQEYFATGEGKDAFGSQQPIAVNASRTMASDIAASLRRSLTGGALSPGFADTLRYWASRHPIHGPYLRRESVLGASWDALGVSSTSLVDVVGTMDRTLRGITLRLGTINESLAEQMRWNAQLMSDEALSSPRGDSLFTTGTGALRSAGLLADSATSLIARERIALLAGIDRQRVLALADVNRQRLETMRDITIERIAVESLIAVQRRALMADVHAERIATMLAVDSLAQRTIDRSAAAVSRLVWLGAIALFLVASVVAGGTLYITGRRRAHG